MNSFFKSVKFKIIVCIASFFLGIGLFSIAKGGINTGVSEFIGTVLNPVKKLSNGIADKVSLVIDLFTDAEVYVKENQLLREEIAALNQRLIDYEDMKSENEDLRKFIGIKEENKDYKLSPPCTIISRTANDPYGTFVIDKGSNDGIKLYDPVVTSEGLVGVIEQVAGSYSTVRTILSPDLSIGGLCVESRDTGIIEGSLSYAADGKCKMIYLDKNHKIKSGDLIITSGNSGQFPQGYVIGNVTETGIEESGLTSYAVIEPAVKPTDINSVIVILEFDKDEVQKDIPEGKLGEKTTEPSTEASTESTSESEANDDNTEAPEDNNDYSDEPVNEPNENPDDVTQDEPEPTEPEETEAAEQPSEENTESGEQ